MIIYAYIILFNLMNVTKKYREKHYFASWNTSLFCLINIITVAFYLTCIRSTFGCAIKTGIEVSPSLINDSRKHARLSKSLCRVSPGRNNMTRVKMRDQKVHLKSDLNYINQDVHLNGDSNYFTVHTLTLIHHTVE